MKRRLIFLLLIATPTLFLSAANQFVEAGAPAPDREWYGSEYQKMAELLASGKIGFPALGSDDGRRMFERMVSVENFSFARNRTLPVGQRLSDSMQLQEEANSIMKLYANKANDGALLHEEVVRLFSFTLRVTEVMLDLVDEFIPTIPHDDKYAVRLDGLKKLKMSVELLFSGAEVSLGERSFYREKDLGVMLTAMCETLPRLKAVFSDNFRVEISSRIRARLPQFSDKAAKSQLQFILNELSAVSRSDNELSLLLVGAWMTDPAQASVTTSIATYQADGTNIETVWVRERPDSTRINVVGTWKIENGFVLSKSVSSSNQQAIPVGLELKDKIIELSENKLILESFEGYQSANPIRSTLLRQKSEAR